MFEIFSRKHLDQAHLEAVKTKLRRFLEEVPLSESALMLDGSGVGCSSGMLALPLLGWARLLKFAGVHSFSATGYALIWYQAFLTGQLKYTAETVVHWNRDNQRAHGLKFPFIHIPQLILRKLSGKKFLFSTQSRAAVDSVVLPGFRDKTLAEFPKNFNFWVYNETDSRMDTMNAESEFNGLTPGEVMQGMAAVPHLYEPLQFRGKKYKDALYFPEIRQHYRNLAAKYKHVLFIHMSHDGIKNNVHFIKAHPRGGGVTRVVVDYLYFVACLENPEFNEGLQQFLSLQPL